MRYSVTSVASTVRGVSHTINLQTHRVPTASREGPDGGCGFHLRHTNIWVKKLVMVQYYVSLDGKCTKNQCRSQFHDMESSY